MVKRMFTNKIGSMVEVYIDDMVVKSRENQRHVKDLNESFEILKRHKLRLNSNKCAFRIGAKKFQGHMITRRGIKVNLDQIRAIAHSPEQPHE